MAGETPVNVVGHVEDFMDSDSQSSARDAIGASPVLSNADIKAAYEANADTNAYTDAESAKLAGVEDGATADQSDAEIETAYNNQVGVMTTGQIDGASTTIARVNGSLLKYAAETYGGGGGASSILTETVTAGDDIAAGEWVFLDPDNSGDAYLVDASDELKSGSVVVGIALEEILTGNTGSIQYGGPYTTTGLTRGAILYASTTPGAATTTRPTGDVTVRPLGVATSATNLAISQHDYVTLSSGINRQTGSSYTLALADINGILEMDVDIANTVSIPLFATVPWIAGGSVTVHQVGAGLTTVESVAGVELNGVDNNSVATQGQWTGLAVYKRTYNADGSTSDNSWAALGS